MTSLADKRYMGKPAASVPNQASSGIFRSLITTINNWLNIDYLATALINFKEI